MRQCRARIFLNPSASLNPWGENGSASHRDTGAHVPRVCWFTIPPGPTGHLHVHRALVGYRLSSPITIRPGGGRFWPATERKTKRAVGQVFQGILEADSRRSHLHRFGGLFNCARRRVPETRVRQVARRLRILCEQHRTAAVNRRSHLNIVSRNR